MIINHPLLGPRDAAEFTYLGDASLIDRPDGMTDDALKLSSIMLIFATMLPEIIANCGFMSRVTGHGSWLQTYSYT
ncbi:MAG: hypothetical protein CM15mP95_0260 [Alphaproteobacteria bacterium]|nr:MAG: hypothetical protein CM15mP95_0260 [Alphaproteobacteria bacterium]